jgi:hypothetical protein
MREMHPDIEGSDEKKLSLRSDRDLNESAVAWLNSQNAGGLMKAGVPTNDANMYLAHFLGQGGAIDVLTKSANTALSTIPSIQKAIEKNPGVFNGLVTTGDLQKWAEQRFGTAFTARTGETDPKNMAAMISGVGGPDSPEGQKLMKAWQEAQLARLKQQQNALEQQIKDTISARQKALVNDDGNRKNEAKAGEEIRAGNYGPSRDPNDPAYAQLIEEARRRDQAENTAAEGQKQRNKFDQTTETLEKQLVVVNDKIAETVRQLQSDGKFTFSNRYYQALSSQQASEQNIQKGLDLGKITPDEADAQRKKSADIVRAQANQEVTEQIAAEQQKADAVQKSMMTESQAREYEFNKEVTRIQTLLSLYQGSGEQRVLVEQNATRAIALLRQQQFQLTPLGGMLKQMNDWGGNMQHAAVGWMNNFNDRLTDLVMRGRTSWRQLTQTILQDIIKLTLQATESKLFSGLLGLGGFTMGGAAGATAGTDGLAAIHHTGGVAGSNMPYRRVPASLFAHAPRFHTGGTVLSAGEVPIIAKHGEEVGWPSQMAAKYGGGGGNFTMGDIHVHGAATNGSPGQNRDLAQQIATHVQAAAREMVGQELRTQMRPGGMLKG